MTTILFERSGGFLGQDISINLDLDALPSSEALSLLHQIQQSNFFRLPENLKAVTTSDEFVYTITVKSGSTSHRVCTTDTGAPESLRPLLNMLSTLAMVH